MGEAYVEIQGLGMIRDVRNRGRTVRRGTGPRHIQYLSGMPMLLS